MIAAVAPSPEHPKPLSPLSVAHVGSCKDTLLHQCGQHVLQGKDNEP